MVNRGPKDPRSEDCVALKLLWENAATASWSWAQTCCCVMYYCSMHTRLTDIKKESALVRLDWNIHMTFDPEASFPWPFGKGAGIYCFADVLKFPTFQEFLIIPCYLRVPLCQVHLYLIVHSWQWLFVCNTWILPCCMPSSDFEVKQRR